jgi:ATP-dependent Lhr-like helicase
LSDYHPSDLDSLCQSGDVIWVGSGKDPRRGRVRLLMRGEGRLFLDSAETVEASLAELSVGAQKVYASLKAEGASFHADIQAATGLRSDVLNDALVELAMAGLATNDTLDALHDIMSAKTDDRPADGEHSRPAPSALEAELAERMRKSAPATVGRLVRPSRTDMREAQRRVTQRMRTQDSQTAEPHGSAFAGRWSLVHRAAVLGVPISNEERADRMARILLERYGIVTRECLAGEDGTVEWGNLYQVMQRMEMRGEVRRGYFVSGLPGVQFALPEAVEKLRIMSGLADDTMLVLSAADPINLFGSELPDGPQTAVGDALTFARVPSTHLVLWQGKPVLLAEDYGDRITTLRGCEPELLQRALRAYVNRTGAPRRAVLTQWNGKPVLGSAVQAWLQPLGFSRTPTGLERWAD